MKSNLGNFETKLRHMVQRASPFLDLCGFQDDGIFRVPSRALEKSESTDINSIFALFCVIINHLELHNYNDYFCDCRLSTRAL